MTRDRSISLLGWLLVVVLTLGFFLLFWNRFAGIRSGLGGYGGGAYLLSGLRPYRDYFAASTPLYILTCGAALRIFGNTITVTRGFGVAERLVIATLVYAWLARFFAVRHAIVATIVTMVASAGDLADPISSYNHETIMWAIGSGFAASFVLDDESTPRLAAIASVVSGILAALSFSTKQTMGLGATVFIPLVVALCLLRLAGPRKAAAFVCCFATGWAISAALLLLWLNSLGVVHEFLTDVFLKGPAAKGANPGDFLRRDVVVALDMKNSAAIGLIALVLLWRTFRRSGATRRDLLPDSYMSVFRAVLVCAVAIGSGAVASYAGFPQFPTLARPAIYLGLVGTFALLPFYLWLCLRGKLSRREAQFFLLATVSFVMAFMVSLSFPAFEAMLLPGIGFLTAEVLDGLKGWRIALAWCGIVFLLVMQTSLKLNRPFEFDGFAEPAVRNATAKSELPELQGLRLPPEIVDFIDGTARIVAARSTASDTIFTYPEMGIFYFVTHRRFPTVSGSHNIDVVNDSFAREEAKRLLALPPAVLIYCRESESHIRGNELLWRGGHRSGQRDIIAALETLTSGYERVRTFELPPDGLIVSVYARH